MQNGYWIKTCNRIYNKRKLIKSKLDLLNKTKYPLDFFNAEAVPTEVSSLNHFAYALSLGVLASK